MNKKLTITLLLGAAVTACLLGSLRAADTTDAKTGTTLENLQAAYNGESNAAATYAAFAKKADEEGYKQVAALFRATSKAESIHANMHAKEIRKLKAEPKATIAVAVVMSTKENLTAAIKGETYETSTMYPGFIKKANEDKNKGAAGTFGAAMACEAGHAKLYQEALANLSSWKTVSKEFLVCTVCGYTTYDTKIKQCPVCFVPRSKFVSFK